MVSGEGRVPQFLSTMTYCPVRRAMSILLYHSLISSPKRNRRFLGVALTLLSQIDHSRSEMVAPVRYMLAFFARDSCLNSSANMLDRMIDLAKEDTRCALVHVCRLSSGGNAVQALTVSAPEGEDIG